MNKKNFVLSAALLVVATAACHAEDAAVTPVTAAAVSPAPTANIDTWIEGVVLTLDADGQKFSVRGVKLPHATAEAEMLADVGSKIKDLDASARGPKEQEVRASWSDKLAKAHGEQLATSTSDFNFSLPDKSTLAVVKGSDPKASPNAVIASSGINVASSVASDAQLKTSGATATTDTKVNADSSAKELTAVKTLKDLKVGDKVKVGYDAGVTYNTAYVVVVE